MKRPHPSQLYARDGLRSHSAAALLLPAIALRGQFRDREPAARASRQPAVPTIPVDARSRSVRALLDPALL